MNTTPYTISPVATKTVAMLIGSDSTAAAAAAEAVAPLVRGGRLVGMTKGHFSLLDLVAAVLDRIGPAELMLSTWTVGIRDAEAAAMLLDKQRLTRFQLLVDRSFGTRQPHYCAAVRAMFGDDAIRATNTHAKVALLRGGGWHIAIRSSMNLNTNKRFEQFDIDDNAQLYAFFAQHFQELSEAMKPGPSPSGQEVEAVFSRIQRGIPPFDILGLSELALAGVPMDSTPSFRRWVDGRGVDLVACSSRLGVEPSDLAAWLDEPLASWLPVACDLAALLLGAAEIRSAKSPPPRPSRSVRPGRALASAPSTPRASPAQAALFFGGER